MYLLYKTFATDWTGRVLASRVVVARISDWRCPVLRCRLSIPRDWFNFLLQLLRFLCTFLSTILRKLRNGVYCYIHTLNPYLTIDKKIYLRIGDLSTTGSSLATFRFYTNILNQGFTLHLFWYHCQARQQLLKPNNFSMYHICLLILVGVRSFSYSSPATWNSIPISIKNCSSLYSLKRHLKSYFIAQLTNN